MRKLSLVSLLAATPLVFAGEGMWTFDNPPLKQIKNEIGATIDQAWLDRAMKGAARIAGGCSASFVSPNGLILTNHHCVRGCVQDVSDAQHDYLANGFHAKNHGEEKACATTEINRLEKITDVTEQVKAATAGKSGTDFTKAQNAKIAEITSACVSGEGAKVRCDVVDLYHGGQYKLYRYHRYQDVRLVFAPEHAIAGFGGDPDNFNFPRYDFDMGLLRVYEDGKPAQIKDHLSVRATGPKDGEAVFVTGNPGSTQRELTVAQLSELRDFTMGDGLMSMYELRGLLLQFRSESTENARVAYVPLLGVENSIKARRGQYEALHDPKFFGMKVKEEQALRQFVASKPEFKASTGQAWDEIAKAVALGRDMYYPNALIANGAAFAGSSYFSYARTLVRAAAERPKANGERLPEFAEARIPAVKAQVLAPTPVYAHYEKVRLAWALAKMRERLGADNAFVRKVLGKASPEQLAEKLVDGSKLNDPAVRTALWEGGADAIAKSDDPFIKLAVAIDEEARDIRKQFEDKVQAVVQKNSELIAKARFAMLGDTHYPDATLSLRLSYGQVKGWTEKGQPVAPFTNVKGVFERHTGAEPFDLPKSWLAAEGKLNPATHFNFVSTNDIIGGNSGSPIVDVNNKIVGLIFDGNIHSLGGAFGYDAEKNRAVSVDAALLLEGLDKIYGAGDLAREMSGQ
ncbi:S46 family peptidase [Burkholderiaceae bacterium DAT-1]|nr:S46 family peptidase [Burkholderiaceae bacterium DAT-1]